MKLPTTSLKNLAERCEAKALKSLSSFENQMEQWIEAMSPGGLGNEIGFTPLCDVGESSEYYIIRFDVPGIKKEHLTIEIEGNELTVRGERRVEHLVMSELIDKYFLSETKGGAFEKSFRFPHLIQECAIEATYSDGVLTIAVKKDHTYHAACIRVN